MVLRAKILKAIVKTQNNSTDTIRKVLSGSAENDPLVKKKLLEYESSEKKGK